MLTQIHVKSEVINLIGKTCRMWQAQSVSSSRHTLQSEAHRPLSRRLDRCDRVIQKESGDPNGGNMCSFSWATGTSRVRHNADYVPCAQIRFDL